MPKKTTLNELGAMLSHVVKSVGTVEQKVGNIERTMATKDDLAKLDVKIDKLDISVHRELEAIKQELKNVSGFGKEIDHALERIAAIEKHLGIEKKIAA
jgi:hypothetical protein